MGKLSVETVKAALHQTIEEMDTDGLFALFDSMTAGGTGDPVRFAAEKQAEKWNRKLTSPSA